MPHRWLVLSLVVVASVGGLALARPAAITAVDQEQPRFNQAAPLPRGAAVLEQLFRAAHNGLSSVDLLAVVYPGGSPTATLTLRLLDSAGQPVAVRTLTGVEHNAPIELSFTPQPNSAGQSYVLQLAGSLGNKTTVWAYSLDGYPDGDLRLAGATLPGDLRFTTHYTYLPQDVLRDSLAVALRLAQLALPIWVILFAPGSLALDLLLPGPPGWLTGWVRWGVALGLSVSLLAFAWLWIGVVGLRWSPIGLGLAYGGIASVVVARFIWRAWPTRRATLQQLAKRQPARLAAAGLWPGATLALIMLVCVVARFVAVRDLAFPPWVDSSHHFVIARLLAETGQVPASYAPVLPIPRFQYHFGFHALAVTLAWLTGQQLIDVFLWLGPVLQGLVPLALYTAVLGLTGRRPAALIAAFFVGLVSFFPGYYATWGRFTELTALLILGPVMAAVWRAGLGLSGRQGPGWAPAALTGLLAGGLLLTHYPVFAMWLVFVALVGVWSCRSARLNLAGAALVGNLAALPWLWRLGRTVMLLYSRSSQPLAAPPGYNAFPWDYFSSSLERGWIVTAIIALAWGLWKRERVLWLTAGWLAALFALVNLGSGNWLVTNNTLAISLFVPGAIALGWGGDQWLASAQGWLCPQEVDGASALLTRASRGWRIGLGSAMVLALSGAAGYAGARGVQTQIAVINPATILATAADRQALDWLGQHLPDDAVVLVNGWEWLNGTWAGSDGGAWIWPLTGRRTTLPPVDYVDSDVASQRLINDFNGLVARTTDANAPDFLAVLHRAGVTHVYIGARGGPLKPEMFVGSPNYRLLYSNGGAWIFALAGS